MLLGQNKPPKVNTYASWVLICILWLDKNPAGKAPSSTYYDRVERLKVI